MLSRKIFFIILSAIILIHPACAILAQNQGTTQTGLELEPVEDQKAWTEDMDKKLDTTIKILEAVREEVKDMPPPKTMPAGPAATPEEQQAAWIDNIRKWTRALSRIWQKVKDELPPSTVEQVEQTKESAKTMSKDLSSKISTTIEAMQAIKEELDKVNQESGT